MRTSAAEPAPLGHPRFGNVIFDFDGTLADSADWFLEAMNESADHFGYRRMSTAEWNAVRACDSRILLERLDVSRWRLPFIARRMRRHAAEHASEFRLFPGVADVLERMNARGTSIAIVSSNGEEVVRSVLGEDLCNRLDVLACGASFLGKGAKVGKVARRMRGRPSGTVYVGDEVRDIDAAARARVRSASVAWGYADAAVLFEHAATIPITRVSDIVHLSEQRSEPDRSR